MSRVCLLVPTLSNADAIGHDVSGMFTVLQRKGVEAHILAGAWAPDVSLPVEPFSQYERYMLQRRTISIYHHSTSWEAGYPRFLSGSGPKVLRYHNVTPPGFFAPYCPLFAAQTAAGRRQTEVLVRSGCVDLFLGDSRYNLAELEALGAPADRCHCLPPFHALQDLGEVPASISVLERYLDATYNVLFLGRVVPNKGHQHLVSVMAAFRRLFSRSVRVFVVGELDHRFDSYHRELQSLAQALRVADTVVWTGKVGAPELKAYLLLSHAFLVMSEHEGFCVPAIEAMAYSIPVVAYASSAVAETVGEAGLVLEGLDYGHYAAALELLFCRPELRESVVSRQKRRIAARFSTPVVAEQFWQLIAPLLGQRP
jgi:glycosyltransferase involved in cell wall biosynthesis